ncbi:unnamed protein product [Phytomonas sp. EM1]|nr:unnamed protein product [Phytomonas sp. EM1]|eukprot:CCW63198.1 unnamed protein product [Phytomonas sp. isolate EM1]
MSDTMQAGQKTQQTRNAYMQLFSDTFSDELVGMYEKDGSADAMQHLKDCIECGVSVWGFPLVLPNPLEN